MKAVQIDQYGSVDELKVRDIVEPHLGDEQVLLEVHASSVNPIDTKVRDGSMRFRYGRDFPKTLGFDASGLVCKVGRNVSRFKVGDAVFTRSDSKTGETNAEYLAVSATVVAKKPENLSHQQAASIPLAGLTALQGLRDDCQLQSGQHVLIVGASGGVGTLCVQIAKLMGAEVTAVCSAANTDFVKGLGADHIIDYTTEPVLSADRVYDAIYDVVGSQRFNGGRQVLKSGGHFAAAVPSLGVIFGMFVGNRYRAEKARFVMCKSSGADLEILGDWLQTGQIQAVIDSTYSLEDIAEAHKRISTRRARGKIVIVVKES